MARIILTGNPEAAARNLGYGKQRLRALKQFKVPLHITSETSMTSDARIHVSAQFGQDKIWIEGLEGGVYLFLVAGPNTFRFWFIDKNGVIKDANFAPLNFSDISASLSGAEVHFKKSMCQSSPSETSHIYSVETLDDQNTEISLPSDVYEEDSAGNKTNFYGVFEPGTVYTPGHLWGVRNNWQPVGWNPSNPGGFKYDDTYGYLAYYYYIDEPTPGNPIGDNHIAYSFRHPFYVATVDGVPTYRKNVEVWIDHSTYSSTQYLKYMQKFIEDKTFKINGSLQLEDSGSRLGAINPNERVILSGFQNSGNNTTKVVASVSEGVITFTETMGLVPEDAENSGRTICIEKEYTSVDMSEFPYRLQFVTTESIHEDTFDAGEYYAPYEETYWTAHYESTTDCGEGHTPAAHFSYDVDIRPVYTALTNPWTENFELSENFLFGDCLIDTRVNKSYYRKTVTVTELGTYQVRRLVAADEDCEGHWTDTFQDFTLTVRGETTTLVHSGQSDVIDVIDYDNEDISTFVVVYRKDSYSAETSSVSLSTYGGEGVGVDNSDSTSYSQVIYLAYRIDNGSIQKLTIHENLRVPSWSRITSPGSISVGEGGKINRVREITEATEEINNYTLLPIYFSVKVAKDFILYTYVKRNDPNGTFKSRVVGRILRSTGERFEEEYVTDTIETGAAIGIHKAA